MESFLEPLSETSASESGNGRGFDAPFPLPLWDGGFLLSTVLLFGLGFRFPVASRYAFRRASSSSSTEILNLAVRSSSTNLEAFPLSFVKQSEGFSSWKVSWSRPLSRSRQPNSSATTRAIRLTCRGQLLIRYRNCGIRIAHRNHVRSPVTLCYSAPPERKN